MRKFFVLLAVQGCGLLFAQFTIQIEAPSNYNASEAYFYTLDGSKDILVGKQEKAGNLWDFKMKNPYSGMMRVYFPSGNSSVTFVSENKDVKMHLNVTNNKVGSVEFLDEPNKILNEFQDQQQKTQYVLPALYQMKEYYKGSTTFGKALEGEIRRLSKPLPNLEAFPFVNFYITNYNRFLVQEPGKKSATEAELLTFLSKTNDRLETSSLMRPVLVAFLNAAPADNISGSIDQLLKAVDIESPRGQTILSELIDIFDMYGMEDLQKRYLTEAENLKCTITDRLASTIASNKNTEIGATFPNTTFTDPMNTKAKTLYDVKANKKVVVFWASTCSHCEKQLPELLEKYQDLKKMDIQIIALSLDSEKASYISKAQVYPWINDSELKGWYSSYGDKYNVHATPTYFVLDSSNKIIAKPNNAKAVLDYFKIK